MSAERTAEVMLADLDGFEDMDPDEAADPVNHARRAFLLGELRILRSAVG